MFKKLREVFGSKKQTKSKQDDSTATNRNSVLINAYCTRNTIPELEFPHHLNDRRDLSDPELAEHLRGFMGYVGSKGGDEMSRTKYQVIRHIQRVQHHLSFSVQEGLFDSVLEWAGKSNAILFLTDGGVRDTHGRVLVSGSDGTADTTAEVPYPVEAWERKTRTETLLAAKGMWVPSHLPPLVSEAELKQRTPHEVAGRALALFLVAVKAESIANNEAISFSQIQERFSKDLTYISPKEDSFLRDDSPSLSSIAEFSWRYESMFLLQWALGLSKSLPFPSGICDVPAVSRIALETANEECRQKAHLRDVSEILDALDLHYRLHWLVRQAQIEKASISAELNEGVIRERHHALNWLVRFEDTEWDEVETPT